MSLSTCWVSRRLQRLLVSAMPSHFQRLPQKTCGLFDTGFAGSDFDAASSGVNAPATEPQAANKLLLLADFEGEQAFSTEAPFQLYPDVNIDNATTTAAAKFEQPKQLLTSDVDTEGWVGLGNPLSDLDSDPLGDSSLDAFINLDQLLMGDAFLDEVNEVPPVVEMKPEVVEPVISIPSPSAWEYHHTQQLDFLDLLESPTEVIPVYQDPSLSHTSTPAAPATSPPSASASKSVSRKRKAPAKPAAGPVKTSMFEISQPISENVVSTTFINPCSPELDHAYTTKPKLSEARFEFDAKTSFVEVAAVVGTPSTSTEATSNEPVDKQSIRRQKNNIASKRSREQRKQKFSDLDREAEELIVANEALRRKIVELEKTAKEMKAVLVAKMSGK